MRRWGCWSVLRFTSVVIHALFGPCLVKPLQFQQCDSKTCSSYIKHLSTDKHYTWYWYLEETCSALLNVKVCPWVIRLTSDPPFSISTPLFLTYTRPPHCLSRAWLSSLQLLAPGLLLKCIIEWAELVGSSESPTESHTEFMFLYESHSDCFCFISLTNCPRAEMLKMGVNWLIMSVLYAVSTVCCMYSYFV